MMEMNEIVTAVITTYKREPEIVKRAIDSVLAQTYKHINIVVVDDSPADYELRDSVEKLVLDHFAEANITYVQHERNLGACAARNTGLSLVNSEFVAFLDDDDEWLPEKIEKQVKKFRECDELTALVYCGCTKVKQNGREENFKGIVFKSGMVFDELILGNIIGSTSIPLIRTKALKDVGGFDSEIRSAQDFETWLRLAERYKVDYVPENLVKYYEHTGARISDSHKNKIQSLERINEKNGSYLNDHKKARWIRTIKIAPHFAMLGELGNALKKWISAVGICPCKAAENLKYLMFIFYCFLSSKKAKLRLQWDNLKRTYKYFGLRYVLRKFFDKIFGSSTADNYIETYYRKLKPEDYPRAYKRMFKRATGKKLNLKNPVTYREKMQWAKLNDTTPIKTQLSDKILVREWVKNKIGEKYLVPIFGVWDKFEDIDFDSLPESFVLKANHGSRMNLLVQNKNELDLAMVEKLTENWLKTNYALQFGLEQQYRNIKPKLFAEKNIAAPGKEAMDYKFLCFDGVPYYCWVDKDRFVDHSRNIYDMEWNLQPWTQGYDSSKTNIPKPENFEEMIQVATVLCEGFSHVRVDLYNIEGEIFFGEMTFTNGGGYERILPEEYDEILGKLWKLPKINARQ